MVEHDFIMATYLADRVVVYDGRPGIECTANSPQGLLSGMNTFLKQLEITFRRDPTNFRPRINKVRLCGQPLACFLKLTTVVQTPPCSHSTTP